EEGVDHPNDALSPATARDRDLRRHGRRTGVPIALLVSETMRGLPDGYRADGFADGAEVETHPAPDPLLDLRLCEPRARPRSRRHHLPHLFRSPRQEEFHLHPATTARLVLSHRHARAPFKIVFPRARDTRR